VDWPDGAPEVILASKACKVISTLGEEKSELRFAWDQSRISACVGRIEIIAKVIDGTFPDYRRVIGQKVDAPLRIEPDVVRGALSRLLVAGDRPDSAVLIDPSGEGVTLSMKAADTLADAAEDVACEIGSQPATAFNARYLQEMLTAIGGDTIEIHMTDAGAPARIVRTIDDGALGTVMPMRR
jgi:DNA polymerase-3 subunit beta